nr:MAG TPA: hypothetical protein [Caudoviricetes sp.]
MVVFAPNFKKTAVFAKFVFKSSAIDCTRV